MNKTPADSLHQRQTIGKHNVSDWLLNQILKIDCPHGRIRLAVITIILLLTWFAFATFFYNLNPPQNSLAIRQLLESSVLIATIFHYLQFLFSLNTIIFIAIIYLAWQMALSINAFFMTRSYDIQNAEKAKKRLIRSAFALGKLDLIEIEEGQFFPHRDYLFTRILGGPALVKIEKENAAVFEQPNGEPIIISPDFPARLEIDGFARPIKLFDGREHSAIFHGYGRSKDGIPLVIKNIKVIFAFHRNQNAGTDQSQADSLDHIYWMTYQIADNPWQTFFLEEFNKEFTAFISQRKLEDIISLQKAGSSITEFSKFQLLMQRNLESLSNHSSYKPICPISIQFRNRLVINRNNPRAEKYPSKMRRMRQLSHVKFAKPPNTKIAISIIDSLFQEFRDTFNLKMKKYLISFDWIENGSLHLPATINHGELWRVLFEIQSWKEFEKSGGMQKFLYLKKITYLSKKIQIYKAYNIVLNGNFTAPSKNDTKLLQDAFLSEVKYGQRLYLRRFGKVPSKIQNMLANQESIRNEMKIHKNKDKNNE